MNAPRPRLLFRYAAAAVASMLAVATVPAQASQCFRLPDDKPDAGQCNTVPFGTGAARSAKYQTLIPAADLGGAALDICSLAFAPCGSGVRTFASLQVRMGYFPGPGTTLGANFANNITAAQLVLDVKDHAWHTTADVWQRIGLQQNFAYDPTKGALVIEITMTDAARFGGSGSAGFRRASTHQRVYATGFKGAPPATGLVGKAALKIEVCSGDDDLALFGIGCTGSSQLAPRLDFTGTARPNATFHVLLSRAPANTVIALSFGVSNAPPRPVDLPDTNGCKLYAASVLSLASRSDAAGGADLPITVPSDSGLACGRIFVQWAVLDRPANILGITSSNYGRVLIGR